MAMDIVEEVVIKTQVRVVLMLWTRWQNQTLFQKNAKPSSMDTPAE